MKYKIGLLLFLQLFAFKNIFAQGGIWTWMRGDTLDNVTFAPSTYSYGVQGVAAPTNDPPPKYQGAHSTDRLNNLWVFGGSQKADLWKYSIATNMWTWMLGDSGSSAVANYGVQGIASPLNQPAPTYTEGMLICDTFNNLWLISGVDNILWKYEMAINQWVWMKGNPNNAIAIYGTMGVANANNTPSQIYENKTSWIDKYNNLWFMDNKNCIWKYSIANNDWTWMKGDTNGLISSYGTKGVSAVTNQPPVAFFCHTSWKDKNDNFYIFDHNISTVWQFNYTTNNWTWVSGDTNLNGVARYVQKCSPSADKTPGTNFEERGASSLLCGDVFWLFGGENNNLWQFNPNTMLWTWVNGDSTNTSNTSYGTKGVPSINNYPPSSQGHSLWSDNNNNLWYFGGFMVNHLWRFVPDYSCVTNSFNPNSFQFLPQTDSIICKGDTIEMQLPDSISNFSVTPNSNYYVSTDSSKIYFYPSDSTVFTLTGNKGFPCPFSASISVKAYVLPIYEIVYNPLDTLLCKGESATLAIDNNYVVQYSPSINVLANADTTLLTFIPTNTTTYTMTTMASKFGCKSIDNIQFTIQVFELPKANFTANPENATIDAPTIGYFNQSTNAVGYHWIYNNQEFATTENTTKTYLDTGTYCITLVACNVLNCCDTILKCNRVVDQLIIIPNAFSPDGNGYNDFFNIVTRNVEVTSIKIFNRLGNEIFATTDQNKGWDGKFKGKICDVGTYFYAIEYSLRGKKRIAKGDVSLIR
jgi:gliding motility-associated-like protein